MVGQPETPNGLGRPRFCDQFVKSASVPWPLGFRLTPTRNSLINAGVKTCVSEIVVWYTRVSLLPVPKPFVNPSAGEPKRPPDSTVVARPRVNLPDRLSAAENR